MSGERHEPESTWLLDGLGAAALVIGAVAVGFLVGLVWVSLRVPV
jgi:hypothetical protein